MKKEALSNYFASYPWINFSSFKDLDGNDLEEPIDADLVVDNANGQPIYYKITNDTELEVTYRNIRYNSYSGNIIIPSEVTYDGKIRKVTKIGDYAFYNCNDLINVQIPNTVSMIGNYTFCNTTVQRNFPIRSADHYRSHSEDVLV